ncbi:MAG: hypothetical protein CM1200mP36_05760 [Gammaproteobacteria bacterium]|nr:MAG: hypothetical protein CM1200mP36_05760 [Gammaproteobacteria bacterium]
MDTVLTGITTTGTPHIGNYVGAIRPTVLASRDTSVTSFYFLADYHSLVKSLDSDQVAPLDPGNCGELARGWSEP